MRGAGAVLMCLLLHLGAQASDLDPWFGQDKGIHFGASAILTTTGYGFSSVVLEQPWQRVVAGSALSLTIGTFKELNDYRHGSTGWSNKDMAFNVIGTVVGAGISLGLDYAIQRLWPSD